MCNAYKLYVYTLNCVGVCVMHISFMYIDHCRCYVLYFVYVIAVSDVVSLFWLSLSQVRYSVFGCH